MKIVKQKAKLEDFLWRNEQDLLKSIEKIARVCYKSEEKITKDSAKTMITFLKENGHLSIFEHFNLTARFITNRGVTHELVRHRIAEYSQESTRYCNYSLEKFGNQISVILPVWFEKINIGIVQHYNVWVAAMKASESYYFQLLDLGQKPQQARGVLPIDLKTEIITTMNLRQWWHVFNLRLDLKSHPQMIALMNQWYSILHGELPFLFPTI